MRGFLALTVRELRIARREGGDASLAVTFFVLAVALFPLGVGPEPNLLSRISGGVLWVTALLAMMLSLERLFQADYEDGSLEILALGAMPLESVVLAKGFASWLLTGLPLLVAAPVLAVLLNMNAAGFGMLALALLLGTPTLTLVGAIGAALTVGARRGGVLLSLLVLPVVVPVLIFGVAAVDAAIADLPARAYLAAVAGLLVAAVVLAPWAAAAALRQALE